MAVMASFSCPLDRGMDNLHSQLDWFITAIEAHLLVCL